VDRENGSYYDLLDDTYNSLCGLDLRLILTTRFEVAGAIEIKQLSNQELYQIFRKHKVNISTKEMDALIQAVDGHTLTIDLMARTMTGSWKKVTADMLLTALQEKDLPNKDYRRVSTDYNRTNRQERIYEHLRTVFNVAGVPEAARAVLCYATLLPQDGMDVETFGMALQEDEQQALDDLINHGWLAVKDDTLTIHPVVRLVCREELKPSDEKCTRFLDAVWKRENSPLLPLQRYRQIAELYAMASEELTDIHGTWALRSGWFYHEAGQYVTALEYEIKSAAIRESNNLISAKDLAAAYNNAGNTYSRLGDANKAFEYQQKAFTILNKELPENHPDLAIIYGNIGLACGDLGDNEFALHCLLKAIDIYEKTPNADKIALAQAYSNAGLCYADISDHSSAINYLEKAISILDENENTTHRALLTIHNNIGGIYCLLGDRQKALPHQLKSLEFLEKLALNKHPDAAAIYHNIAMSYGHLGNLPQALNFEKKSLFIAEQSYPSNHQQVVIPKHNIAYIEKVLKSKKSKGFR
jgi:tetratricopeptide (TPR) repeat protein